jgi:hypothetical protein
LIAFNGHLSFWTALYGNTDLASAYLDLGQDVNAKSSMFVPTIVVCFCLRGTHITFCEQT